MSDETQGQPPQEQPQQQPGSPPPNWQQPPGPGPAPNPDPYGLGPTSMGMAPTAAAALSYVFGWITGLIFFLSEKTNKYVRFHAMQSILMSVAWTVFVIIWYVVMFIVLAGAAATGEAGAAGGGFVVFIMTCLMWIFGLGFFILWLICLIQAATGKWFKLPVIGDIAAKQAGV